MFDGKQMLTGLLLSSDEFTDMKSGKRRKPSLLGEEKGIREQMANFHLERTMTDFRQQQWSPRLCTFFFKRTGGTQQHSGEIFLSFHTFVTPGC